MAKHLMELVHEYLHSMAVESGKAPMTVINYGHYLGRFVDFVGDVPCDKLTIEQVRAYQASLTEYNLARATQNYHMIALRSFLRHSRIRGYNVPDPGLIELSKHIQPTVSFLDADEVKRLLAQPKTNNMLGLRDRAILELLFCTGMRVSELVSVDREQLSAGNRELTIRGKGSKLRPVFVSEPAAGWVNKYLAMRHDDSPALFVEGSTGATGRLQPRSIQRLVKRYAELAGITKEVTPHTLRHSFATLLMSKQVDIRMVQEMLGHASIMTTQRYTHVTNRQLKNIHDKHLNLEEG